MSALPSCPALPGSMNGLIREESQAAVPFRGIWGEMCFFTNCSAATGSSSKSTACNSIRHSTLTLHLDSFLGARPAHWAPKLVPAAAFLGAVHGRVSVLEQGVGFPAHVKWRQDTPDSLAGLPMTPGYSPI